MLFYSQVNVVSYELLYLFQIKTIITYISTSYHTLKYRIMLIFKHLFKVLLYTSAQIDALTRSLNMLHSLRFISISRFPKNSYLVIDYKIFPKLRCSKLSTQNSLTHFQTFLFLFYSNVLRVNFHKTSLHDIFIFNQNSLILNMCWYELPTPFWHTNDGVHWGNQHRVSTHSQLTSHQAHFFYFLTLVVELLIYFRCSWMLTYVFTYQL